MDLERLKEKRKVLRSLFTRHLAKIKNSLETEITTEFTKEIKIEELSSFRDLLIEKFNELIKIDEEVQAKIKIADIEADISTSEEYKDKGTDAKSKIDRCLGSLYGRPRNVAPENISDAQSGIHLENSVVSSTITRNVVKLPKLDIKKFYGDCSLWLDFWNSYEVAIHNNDTLSKIEKFTYLKTYLGGVAWNAVSGFSLTEQNYDASVQLLKERFGRTDVIISSHMHKLLLIDPVKSCANVTGLRKMYDAIEVQIRSLKSLNVATGTYGNLLCPVILQKLPEELNLNYNRNRKSNELFDISDLIEYIRKELEIRETSIILANPKNTSMTEPFRNNVNQNKHQLKGRKPEYFNSRSTAAVLATKVEENSHPCNKYSYSNNRSNFNLKRNSSSFRQNRGNQCVFCSDSSHMTHDCLLDVDDRKKALIAQGLCFICFQGHLRKFCNRKQKCRHCNSLAHNWLICGAERNELKSNRSDESQTQTESSLSLYCNNKQNGREVRNSSVLLQTFTAAVLSSALNKVRNLRCMIDGGSTKSFVTRESCELLGLKVINKEALVIYSFGESQAEKKIYDIVELVLCNVGDLNRKIKIRAVVVDLITLGQIEIPSKWIRDITLEKGIVLADQGASRSIQILIGSDYIGEILGETNIKISKRLVATDTIFGFVIQGRDEENNCQEVRVNHLIALNEELDNERVKRIWELEAIGISPDKENSRTDKGILESFKRNTTYKNGRYETELLWKDNQKELLNNNYKVAKRRLVTLNNTFNRNEQLYLKYKDIISEQLTDGIIELVEPHSELDKQIGYFMPHHAVVRECKETTKVRICYDASSKAKGELSLNDCLESGPNLNPDLLKIILKFRYHPIAFCADIQRAFLEVGIVEEDRKFLKFLWGMDGNGSDLHFDPPNFQVLQFTRVPFGVKCSPFLLAATIRLHANKYKPSYPEACNILDELYVDDLIQGAESIEKAAQVSKDCCKILKSASMNLRQWCTNSRPLEEIWEENGLEVRRPTKETNVPLTVLGLVWDKENDNLSVAPIDLEVFRRPIITKRMVLKACGMLFDPLGMLAPFTIRIKLVLQNLWEQDIQWDDPIPADIEVHFRKWLGEGSDVQDILVPRQYFHDHQFEDIELHLFSDASPKAYGAVAYFRVKYPDGKIFTSFVMSKVRLSPLKKLSLPRLELMGALASARLSQYLKSTFEWLDDTKIHLWTDSQICLHWIKGSARQWKQFVSNRVLEIQEKTKPHNWNFCKGKENPADKLTRGLSAYSLINDKVWWTGPAWLLEVNASNDEVTPIIDMHREEIENERRREVPVLLQTCDESEPLLNLEKYSDVHKVYRITAYITRFVHNSKPNSEKKLGALTSGELSLAEKYWIRHAQQEGFKEYSQLKTKTSIGSDSKLYNLDPIFTADGLIALKGRLQNSDLDIQSKHPIILPNKNRFTELLIMNEHKNVLHSGVSDTLTQLRERFWIIRGRQAVKSCLNKCLRCRRFKAKQGKQVVAPLPATRINEAQPFEVTAIDFAGPLYTKDNNKSYIALFTCAVTRAVHLEVVSSLSTEHFLLAFRRFVSRRGVCRVINSDNALTFKGADAELKRLYANIKNSEVQNYFGKKGITWQYIVERAAWWGGYWERMVRMTKIVLRKILGRALVTFEELQTILAEIESVLNSRPLTYVYNEPAEPSPLTPAHFLIGRRLTALPPHAGRSATGTTSSTHKVLIKRYLYREKLLNQFWKRWKGEYLLQLKNVNIIKPVNVTCKFNIGDIVLIADDKMPRQMWRMGKITELHLGRDKQVRAVTLKTSSGQLKRPIQLLYHLEISKP